MAVPAFVYSHNNSPVMDAAEIALSVIIVLLSVLNILQATMLRHNKTIIRMLRNEVKDLKVSKNDRQEFF
jgi:hypothetical protein